MTRYATARKQPARPVLKQFMTGSYTCPELGPTCFRPGAYDAFQLPSLFGRHLHFPDGRVIERDAATPEHRPVPRA